MQSKPPLSLGFCGDQIRKAFGDRQVHLAIRKSTSRKLSSFRYTATMQLSHFRQELLNDCFAAMQMKFSAIFAGKTVRSREKKRQSTVDWITISATE